MMYDFFCLQGHREEHFVHCRGVETFICACGESMTPVGFGVGQTWFRENNGQWIHNLGPQPVYVTSAEQHKAEMKKAGVEWDTGWSKNKTKGWV